MEFTRLINNTAHIKTRKRSIILLILNCKQFITKSMSNQSIPIALVNKSYQNLLITEFLIHS